MRARDGNGVAGGADQAVEAAASSGGSGLPAGLRDLFEASLGADLSAVRVHTGGESAAAASAVGARAYATGNDIHFGAGHYDPDSRAGQVLIAHEVAHTVQQAGGPPSRQHQLEVSTPGDAAELEADRAADAMVSGAPTSIGAAARGAIRRAPDPAPAADDAGLPDAQRDGLARFLPHLADAVAAKDGPLVESLVRVSRETADLIEAGTPEEQGGSLWLNWVAKLPEQTELLGDVDATRTQVWILDTFLVTAAAQLTQVGDKQLAPWVRRVQAMRSFYASMTEGVARPGDLPEQAPVSALRQAMVGLALAQIGKVHASQFVEEDGQQVRVGWRTLKLIWDTAFGGTYPDQQILKTKRAGKKLNHKAARGPDGKYPASEFRDVDDVLDSWCGIFPTAIAKMANANVPDWTAGGVTALPATVTPKPGDIVNKVDRNHFGIITWVDTLPDSPTAKNIKSVKIRTVEGNTDGGQILDKGESEIRAWDYGVRSLEPPAPVTTAP
jgi:hypothetical protein